MPYIARTHQLKQSLLYHIYNRGNAREQIFYDTEDYRYFIVLIAKYSIAYDIQVYHWVIMPNHYHMIIEIKEPEKISSIMAGIGRSYVHYYHKKYKSSGHLWEGRFKSQPIQKEMYLLTCGRYIERNPVKAGLVKIAEEYRYSSACYYVHGKDDSITIEDPIFSTFGKEVIDRRGGYKRFLETFDSEEERLFENLEEPQGSKEFVNRLVKEKGLFLPMRQGRPRK